MASGSVDNMCIFNILHDILKIIWNTVRWWGKKWTTISTRWNFAGVNCPKLKTYRTGAESDQSPRTDECHNGTRWVESVFSACKIREPDVFWMAKQAGARFPDGLGEVRVRGGQEFHKQCDLLLHRMGMRSGTMRLNAVPAALPGQFFFSGSEIPE